MDDELKRLVKRFSAEPPPVSYPRRYNIRPTQAVPVILNTRPGQIELASWGITPFWDVTGKKQIINARKDSLEKPTFKKSFYECRCLVLADSFYEWMVAPGQSRKRLFRFLLKTEEPFAFAGIWREQEGKEGGEPRGAIITTEPNEIVSRVHHRMPAILQPEAEAGWLNLDTTPEQALELLQPYPEVAMQAYKVSTLTHRPMMSERESPL